MPDPDSQPEKTRVNELTIFGIPNCDTCRKARKWLADHGHEYRFHDLREDGLDIQMLQRWADRLDWQSLLNTRSLSWRKVSPAERADMTKKRAFSLMRNQPTLVKRPLLERGDLVAVGYSSARYEQLFTSNISC